MFRPEPVISAVRLVLTIGYPLFSFQPKLNAGGLESIAGFITLSDMTRKLSREEVNGAGPLLLAWLMDASRILGSIETIVAGYAAGDQQRDFIISLVVKQV